jgi:hypothetical protein
MRSERGANGEIWQRVLGDAQCMMLVQHFTLISKFSQNAVQRPEFLLDKDRRLFSNVVVPPIVR